MSKYLFELPNPEAREFCDEVRQIIEWRLGVGRDEAIGLVNQYWKLQDFEVDDLRYHELPYYWAMSMVHGVHGDGNSRWQHDPNEWPPPADLDSRLHD